MFDILITLYVYIPSLFMVYMSFMTHYNIVVPYIVFGAVMCYTYVLGLPLTVLYFIQTWQVNQSLYQAHQLVVNFYLQTALFIEQHICFSWL
jgi:hypothetical protein